MMQEDLMPDNAEKLITITDPEQDRYASLRLIDWWQQELVSTARVMVVGAGALGNEVLKNLALLGVGYIFIVDFDVVEAANLTRSVLFRPEDGGQPKAVIAARSLQALNPDVKVIAFTGDVTQELGLGVYRRMDVVIGCLDNRSARVAVNAACWNNGKAWIDGALDVLDGRIQVFCPPEGPCYECTMTDQDYQLLNLRYSCPPGFALVVGQQPTLPMTASIIASMQVQEAVKLLHHLPVQAGQAVYYSGETMRLSHMQYPRRQDCPAHHTYEAVISLPYGVKDLTLAQLLRVVRSYLHTDGIVYLPQSVVTSFYCAVCGTKEEVYQPYALVVPKQVRCQHCGAQRSFDVTGTFATNGILPELPVPLTQVGVPALHILPVHTQDGWYYFELSADEQYLLHDWIDK
jgi:molybdopterin/thiamine biosynthesis adenylyltransferase